MKPSVLATEPTSHTTPLTTNKHLIRWVEKMAELCRPEAIHWVDGSQEEYDALCDRLVAGGHLHQARTRRSGRVATMRAPMPSDVARVEDRTFICSLSQGRRRARPTTGKIPIDMRRKLKELFRGSMRGRTMYVLPFSMGPVGSPMSQIGVQLTDSPYVVVRCGSWRGSALPVFAEIDKDDKRVVPCMHSVGMPLKPGEKDVPWPCNETKYIVHFPETPRDLVVRLRLRRQRAAGQEVFCPSHRLATSRATRAGWPSTC